MNIETTATFFFQSFVLIGGLAVLGYPIRWLLQRISGDRLLPISAPLLGVYPLVQVAWVWSGHRNGGLHAVIPIVVGLASLVTAVLLTLDLRSGRISLDRRSLMIWAALSVMLSMTYLAVFHVYFTLDYTTPASLGNLDEAAFAIGAEHLRNHGLADSGNISGLALGPLIRTDTIGTYVLDLLPGTLLHRATWLTTASTLFGALWLILRQGYLFAHKGLRVRRGLASLSSLCAVASPLTFFILGHGYMSQLFGTALFLGGLTLLLTFRARLRSASSTILALAVISAALWHVYPYVAIVMPVLGLAIRVVVQSPRRWPKLAISGVAIIAAEFILAAVLAGHRFRVGYDQAVGQGSATAGWAIGALSPHEILGFSSDYRNITAPNRWVIGGLVTAGMVIAAIVLWKRLTGRLAVAVLIVGFASYIAIYFRSGESYQQWKWAALLAPMLTIAFVSLLSQVARKLWPTKFVARVATGMICVVIVAFAWNTHRMTNDTFTLARTENYISPDLADVANNKQIAQLRQMGLNANAWDEMWTTSFFPHTQMAHFVFYNYYPLVRIPDLWTLERRGATAPVRVVNKSRINSTYELLERRPAGQAVVEILSETNARNGNGVDWRVRVTNTGKRTWVSPLDDDKRGFSLRADVISASTPHIVINSDLPPQSLPKGRRVPPGGSFVFEGHLAGALAGDRALQFDPAETDIGPYEMWTPETVGHVS